MVPRVYLGGSCGRTTWRRAIAIPMLKEARVDFIDPQLGVGAWTESHEQIEIAEKATCDVMLWVITSDTRAVASVAEAAFYIAERRPLALALEMLGEKVEIGGRRLRLEEIDDLNRGRLFLRTVADEAGIPVFGQVPDAVQYALQLCADRKSRLTAAEITCILSRISCREYRFLSSPTLAGPFLQIEAPVTDVNSNLPRTFRGRRWFLEPDASAEDLVRTALKAVVTWEEHEVRENFRFDGVRIFDPHLRLDQLLTLAEGDTASGQSGRLGQR